MAYDRYDSRGEQRGHRDDRQRGYGSSGSGNDRDDRGFFERARDEVTSWFGDEESERRRHQDDRMSHPGSSRGYESSGDNQRRGYDDRYGSQQRSNNDDQGRQRLGREDDRFGHSDRGAFFGGGQSTSFGRGRDEGDYKNQYGRGGGESGGFGRGDYGHQSDDYYSRQGQDYGNLGQGRSYPSGYGQTGGGSYRETQHQGFGGRDRHDDDHQSRSYQSQGSERQRPLTGDYARGSNDQGRQGSGMGGQAFGREQYGRQEFSQDQDQDRDRTYNYGGWGDRDSQRQSQNESRSSGFMGAGAATGASSYGRTTHDEHYSSWRQRQIEDLDRDYDEYRREHQSRFENEFTGFRQQRQTKRQMLQSIREHFEVVDESGQHIGAVDKVAGDKIIMTRNDPEAGGVHRSFTCTQLERVEDNKVYLSGSKESIRSRLTVERDDDHNQGRSSGGGGILGSLFGSESNDSRNERPSATSTNQPSGEGPHMLDQSFSGTYDEDGSTKK